MNAACIKRLENHEQAEICANMMVSTEPWITLKRDYATALKRIRYPNLEVYLAIAGADEIAGFIILCMQGPFIGYIQTLCIAPNWRNRGLGSHLISFAEKRVFSETPNVFICVSSFNQAARRLYERLGYKMIGELADFVVTGHGEFLLRKTIAPLAEFVRSVKVE